MSRPDDRAHPGRVTSLQWQAMRGFALVGLLAIIAGGLVAAVTGPTALDHGSWLAAYLVLVVGVAQAGLGVGQGMLAATPPSRTRRRLQLALYNVANLAVIVGTLSEVVVIVVVGGVLLLVALVDFLNVVARPAVRSWHLVAYRGLVALLAVSVPVGLVLAALRQG